MTAIVCEFCGFHCYETSTPGVVKCSGCGETYNDWDEEEEE